MRNQILLCGTDSVLLRTRRDVLRSVGYEALTLSGTGDIESTIQSCSVDALVLCHTLTSEQHEAALAALRRHSAEVKSVIMEKSPTQEVRTVPDAFVSTSGGPQAFIQTLGRLLSEHFVGTDPTFRISGGLPLQPSHG